MVSIYKETEVGAIKNKIKVLSGAQLKYIAFLSMLIDHTNKALIYPNLNGGRLNTVSNIFDIIGRIAFPIFAFLLVEGFFKTRSRTKYLATLLVFGVISEVPFDLFTTKQFFEPNWNNIMFTLALMLVTIWMIDVLKKKMEKFPKILWFLLSFVILALMCLIAAILSLDYDCHDIFHGRELIAIPFNFLSMYKEPWALLGFGLVLTYNGERGKQNKLINYLFYPVHLLILGLLRIYLGI